MMKKSMHLQTKLTLILVGSFTLIILLLNLSANYFVNRGFENYVNEKEQISYEKTKESIEELYNPKSNRWDQNGFSYIGTQSLEKGQIIKVVDQSGKVVFDMEQSHSKQCRDMMNGMSNQHRGRHGKSSEPSFIGTTYDLQSGGKEVGSLIIKHTESTFFSEQDMSYVSSMNKVMFGVGLLSLAFAVLLGRYLALRIARPLKNSVNATRTIASGDYSAVAIDTSSTIELEELMDSIQELSNTLQKGEILRQDLTANLAHELRTPLTTLSTYVESMMLGVWEVTPDRLEELYHEINRISTMVEDLESIAKSDNKMLDLKLTTVDLKCLVQHSIDLLSKEASLKNIKISYQSEDMNIKLDEKRMHQVIYNIMHNAIKYSKNDTEINVSNYRSNQYAVIEIKDQGVGIPKEEVDLIFERLYRSEKSRNRQTGGSGIGLTIAKSIVDAHGGNISVESDGHTYSIFKIFLPIE